MADKFKLFGEVISVGAGKAIRMTKLSFPHTPNVPDTLCEELTLTIRFIDGGKDPNGECNMFLPNNIWSVSEDELLQILDDLGNVTSIQPVREVARKYAKDYPG